MSLLKNRIVAILLHYTEQDNQLLINIQSFKTQKGIIMTKIKRKRDSLAINQHGQGLMEYMILTGLISILCLVTIRNFGETVKNKMQQATEKINRTIVIR